MFVAPLLETQRLRLRAHRLEDFPACAAMWADPVVVKHIGGAPFRAEETWARMLRYAGHWTWLGYGFWAVEELASGALVGEVGLADFRRDITPSLAGMVEVGWAFASRAHGKGYATEALAPVLAWGDARFPQAQKVALIDDANAASKRVAEKHGFRPWTATTYHGAKATLFRR